MSTFNAPAYDVQRPTGHCALTGRALTPHEPYIATLIEDGELFRRADVCLEAWQQGRRPDGLFSYWKAVVPESNAKRKVFVDDDVLMDLLRRLADVDDPRKQAFRFVLMLILMRKKLLRYDRTETLTVPAPDGRSIDKPLWIVTPKLDLSKGPLGKWDESARLQVLDPQLDDDSIRQTTEQLGDILQAEL
jgi:hypothetical protein